jgi:predicted Zn-dependent peptidase
VAAAGNLQHALLVKEMNDRLGSVTDAVDQAPSTALEGERAPEMGSGVYAHAKSLEQVHLCLGVAGIHQAHPKRYAAYVLNTLLGGGMSSRLFQEIREKRGKAYSVYSFSSSYKDVGYIGVYAGTSVDWAEEVVELILKELKKLAAGEITDAELNRTRGQLVGSMMLGLESTDSWMSHIARNEVYFGKPISTDEICRRIRAVSRDDVIELAGALFRADGMTLTLLGDFADGFQIKSLS